VSGSGRLEGRVAIVTGAADGIGRGISRRFAAEGAKVLVVDLDGDKAKAVTEDIVADFDADARALVADVSTKSQVASMVQTAVDAWGTVHVLVNNAWGGASFGPVEEKTDAQLAHGFGLAFYGPFWAMQAAFPHMKAQGWGRVINMCSAAGPNAMLGTLEYNCAKEALRTLTRTAAREWAPYGIVANAILPGAKGSGMVRRYAADPALEAQLDASNPMGRIGDPETDIGPVAVFLASDDCRYFTGNSLWVDGGNHIGGGSWQPATWAKEHPAEDDD
jgi:NAD(P)-dependent dehydrogenase (short-subunit alcohol dehydrogenase family)